MIVVPNKLIEKYNVPIPRYTSYPPANFFTEFNEDDYIKALEASNHDEPRNISIYIHIPFCSKICHYCGCNTQFTRNRELMRSYVDVLKKEILMVRKKLDTSRKISQVHWGGGTPNYLPIEWIEEIMQLIHDHFSFIENPEIAMECHPYHLSYEYTERLINSSFNRISLGIQDFNKKVLDIVNRDDSAIPIEELVAFIRRFNHVGLNFDFIYGLPHQNPVTFTKTLEKAVELSPDRLVTFSYAHVPWVRKAQKILEVEGIANAQEKLAMFESGYNLLLENGYHAIGLDHFAKSNDELTIGLKNRKLHRNFQGYCTRETTGQVYAFGASGISQLDTTYAQNTKDTNKYVELVSAGKFAIEKGYSLNLSEKITRKVINEIMCNQYINWEAVANEFSLDAPELKSHVHYAEEDLDVFQSEGLIVYNNDMLEVSETGKLFMRNIAGSFDPNLKVTNKKFSKSL